MALKASLGSSWVIYSHRSKALVLTVCLAILSACVAAPKKAHNENKSLYPSAGPYHDGNRAPASMSPPFDMGPDKIALDPIYMRTKADYHFTLAEAYSFDGESNKAIEEYKLTSVYDPHSAVVRLKLAVEYVKKGLVSEAMTQAEEAVKLDGSYVEARLLLGGIYTAIKLFDKAEEQYRQVMNETKSKEAALYLGALLTEQKKFKQAIDVFTGLTKDAEFETPQVAHYYLARVYVEKGDEKQAEAQFTKALQIRPSFVEAALALGTLYEAQNKRDKAVTLYESYQDKHGPSEKVAESLSRLYLEDEKYDKALSQLEIMVAADQDNLNARVKVALILIEMKEYKKAVTRLKEILAQAPDSDKIRFFLGAVYEEVKDYNAAIEQFGLIGAGSSYYGEAIVHASYLHKIQSNLPQAIATIEKGIELRPDYAQFYPLYASYLDDAKEYKKAVTMLDAAVKRFPDNDQLFFFLGSLQDKMGNKQGTVLSMQKTIEINPDHIQALNYLAYTYAEMNQNLDEAYSLAKKALKLKPDDAYIQDTVGWIYYKKGNYADAVRVLEAAHKNKSDESIIAEHLGDAYYKYKLPNKAREMYLRAVKFETNRENVKKLEAKISAIDENHSKDRMPASASAD